MEVIIAFLKGWLNIVYALLAWVQLVMDKECNPNYPNPIVFYSQNLYFWRVLGNDNDWC